MEDTPLVQGPPRSAYRKVRVSLPDALRQLTRYSPLLAALVRREFQSRYKQTRLGFLWAIVTPIALLLVFTLVLNRVADLQTGERDYAVFAYIALLPWTFFASALSRGGQSLVLESRAVARIRAPREVFPLSFVAVALIDFFVAVALLPALFIISGETPAKTALWFPLPLLVMIAFATGTVLLASSVIVFFRDLQQALPLLLQLGLFATPVAYGIDLLSERNQVLFAWFNPMAGIITTLRATVLDGQSPPWHLLGPSAATTTVLLAGGYWVFKRLEPGMADVA